MVVILSSKIRISVLNLRCFRLGSPDTIAVADR